MAIPRLGSALAAITAFNTAAQIHVFVDDDAPDGGNGLSWATAKNDLREAVQLAENLGEFRGEVRIAGGSYLGDLAEPLEIDRFGGQLSGIVLRGAFAGLAMPGAPDTRCLSSFATTLRSGGFGPIAQISSAAVLTGERLLGPGPFGALGGVNGARATVFDGLRFVGTQAIAVSAEPDAAVIVRDCEFIDARGGASIGGAIDARSVSLLVESSEFIRCTAEVQGGAIRHVDGAMIVRDSVFEGNTARLGDGGAMFLDSDAVLIEQCVYTMNEANSPGSVGSGGGAIYVERGQAVIDHNQFRQNQSDFGGAIYFADSTETSTVSNSEFDQNSALSGGTIAGGEGVRVRVTHSVFTRGNASGPGAIDADFVSIDESEFIDNFGGSSGAIRVRVDGLVSTSSFRDNFGVQVGAVDIREDLDILDCEFISNLGNFGGAVRSQGRGTIARSRFELNQAEDGGAIFGPAVVSASVLSFNRAARFGGAAFGLDTFAESTADNNTAEIAGGGLYDTRLVTDAVVRDNLAPEAPGVWVGERGSDIRRSQLASASNETVRVEANAAPATIADSLVVGGVRARSGAFVELIRSTSVRGANSTGNILDVDATSALVAESTVIDGGGIELMPGATVLLVQSHLSAGLDAVTGDATGLEVFGVLSQGAPGFVSPAGTDGIPATWPDNDYSLRPRSPLIDRGFALGIAQDATDIRGFFRVRNDAGVPDRQIGPAPVDTGAFEFQGTSCLADINDDGRLSPGDFNAWILAYNLDDRFADQNQDGFLTPADFNAWTINFNAGCD